jgi:hypothetical protein
MDSINVTLIIETIIHGKNRCVRKYSESKTGNVHSPEIAPGNVGIDSFSMKNSEFTERF